MDANMSTNKSEVPKPETAKGMAALLSVATALPPNVYHQNSYPHYYFSIINAQHCTHLKDKFSNICNKSEVKKRHLFLTEEILKANPNLCKYEAPSLNTRQQLVEKAVPALGAEAAEKAILQWGQPKSTITHLIFCTTSNITMPGGDYHIAKLLGLSPSVPRFMLYLQGCSAGATLLRLAKDLAENNKGARVLCVSSELSVIFFRGIEDSDFSSLIGPALFGDGAGAIVVGADPIPNVENALFELVIARQSTVPDTDGFITGNLVEHGLTLHLTKELPDIVADNIEDCLIDALDPVRITDWNSLFWIVHPGGPQILRNIEATLGLNETKLQCSWEVLREYGNMSSSSVFFIIDEMMKRSVRNGELTTGEGHELGVLLGIGPGLSIETVVLKSMPLKPSGYVSSP